MKGLEFDYVDPRRGERGALPGPPRRAPPAPRRRDARGPPALADERRHAVAARARRARRRASRPEARANGVRHDADARARAQHAARRGAGRRRGSSWWRARCARLSGEIAALTREVNLIGERRHVARRRRHALTDALTGTDDDDDDEDHAPVQRRAQPWRRAVRRGDDRAPSALDAHRRLDRAAEEPAADLDEAVRHVGHEERRRARAARGARAVRRRAARPPRARSRSRSRRAAPPGPDSRRSSSPAAGSACSRARACRCGSAGGSRGTSRAACSAIVVVDPALLRERHEQRAGAGVDLEARVERRGARGCTRRCAIVAFGADDADLAVAGGGERGARAGLDHADTGTSVWARSVSSATADIVLQATTSIFTPLSRRNSRVLERVAATPPRPTWCRTGSAPCRRDRSGARAAAPRSCGARRSDRRRRSRRCRCARARRAAVVASAHRAARRAPSTCSGGRRRRRRRAATRSGVSMQR